ncbi:hypothetical protein VULLAG_LOCUS10217 [Vulpes lagopus]
MQVWLPVPSFHPLWVLFWLWGLQWLCRNAVACSDRLLSSSLLGSSRSGTTPSRCGSLCTTPSRLSRALCRSAGVLCCSSAGGRAGVALPGYRWPLPPHLQVPLTACLWFSFQAERPALNVVIFPLLHEGLTNVIRDVPMVHLDEITLFKSRVAEEPPNLWW